MIFGIIITSAVMLTPLIINILYMKDDGFVTVWGGSDILVYCGGIISALIAAIISYLTLDEMQVQRDKAYQPNLSFYSLRIRVDTGIKKVDGCLVNRIAFTPAGEHYDEISNVKIKNMTLEELHSSSYIFLNFCNSGVGVCKDLIVEFDVNDIRKWAKVFHEKEIIQITEENDSNIDFTFHSFSSNNEEQRYEISNDCAESIQLSFLEPNCNNKGKLRLPFYYQYFMRMIDNYDRFEKIKEADLPLINVKLRYKDIQGKEYKQFFKIAFKPFSTNCTKKNTLELIYDISAKESFNKHVK